MVIAITLKCAPSGCAVRRKSRLHLQWV